MRNQRPMAVALVVSALVLAAPAGSAPLVWDFESGAASFQWSDTTVSGYAATDIGTGTPFVGQFLGPFENESVDLLCMDCFEAATPYSIAFDVLVLGSWLGSTPGQESLFTVSAYTGSPGGWDPLRTVSFSTTAAPQSFPDAFGTGSHPAYTGAQATLQLPSGGAVFRIELVAPGPTPVDPENCCGDVALRFEAQGLVGAQWGIDNLVVTAVPEPGTLGLLGLGLAGLCVVRRSRGHPPV